MHLRKIKWMCYSTTLSHYCLILLASRQWRFFSSSSSSSSFVCCVCCGAPDCCSSPAQTDNGTEGWLKSNRALRVFVSSRFLPCLPDRDKFDDDFYFEINIRRVFLFFLCGTFHVREMSANPARTPPPFLFLCVCVCCPLFVFFSVCWQTLWLSH